MSGSVRPWTHLSLLSVPWKCDLAGQVSAMLHLLQMVPCKMLTTFPLQIQNSWQLSLLELPPCCVPTRNTVTSSSDFSDLYNSIVPSGPPLLMQHSLPTLIFKPLIPLLPILYLLPLPPHHRPFWLSFYASCLLSPPDSLRVLYWNAEGLRAESTELLHFLSSQPVDLICIQKSIVTHLPLSGFLDSLLCVLIAPILGLAFSLVMSRTLAAASSFSSSKAYPFLNSLPPLSLLHPHSDYVAVNISQNNSSSLSFLNVYAPLFALLCQMAEPTPFLSPFFPPPGISLFWGTSTAITPFRTQEVLPIPVGRKYSIWSSHLISSPSMTLTYLPFSIAFPLTSPLLAPLSPFSVPWRCFRTWVLIIYQFFYLSLSLRSFAPTSAPFLQFSESSLGWLCLLLCLLLSLSLYFRRQKTRLFLFPLLLLSLPLWY